MTKRAQATVDLIGVAGLAAIAAGILMLASGCTPFDKSDSHDSETTVNSGIQIPTNAVEIAEEK